MRMSSKRLFSVEIALCLLFATRVACAGVFADGFEGAALDPFWSTFTQNGSISLTTDIAHSGNQSARFSSFNTFANKYEYLFHDFSTPTYGTTSVWIFDTGAGVASSNYIGFLVENANTGFYAGLTTYDFGFPGGGPGRGDQYNFYSNGFISASGINRTRAWHQYAIVSTPTELTLKVDGISLYSQATGNPFTQVRLYSQAPDFRPAFTQYFDDFVFESFDVSTVPEPFSVVLWSLFGLATLLYPQRFRSKLTL